MLTGTVILAVSSLAVNAIAVQRPGRDLPFVFDYAVGFGLPFGSRYYPYGCFGWFLYGPEDYISTKLVIAWGATIVGEVGAEAVEGEVVFGWLINEGFAAVRVHGELLEITG